MPIMEYAGAVWDPYTNDGMNTIEKVQRRAARWIANKYDHDTDTNRIMESLCLPSLVSRRRQSRLSTFYKLHHGQTEILTRNKPQISTRRRSNRTTHPLSYTIHRSRTTCRQKSFFPKTTEDWNKLPEEIVSAPGHDEFLAMLEALNTAQRLSPT